MRRVAVKVRTVAQKRIQKMLIALGTPRILTERINNEDGGFYHNFKVSNRADLDDDPSIIAIRRNLTRGLFVTISYSSISLWAIKVAFI